MQVTELRHSYLPTFPIWSLWKHTRNSQKGSSDCQNSTTIYI